MKKILIIILCLLTSSSSDAANLAQIEIKKQFSELMPSGFKGIKFCKKVQNFLFKNNGQNVLNFLVNELINTKNHQKFKLKNGIVAFIILDAKYFSYTTTTEDNRKFYLPISYNRSHNFTKDRLLGMQTEWRTFIKNNKPIDYNKACITIQ